MIISDAVGNWIVCCVTGRIVNILGLCFIFRCAFRFYFDPARFPQILQFRFHGQRGANQRTKVVKGKFSMSNARKWNATNSKVLSRHLKHKKFDVSGPCPVADPAIGQELDSYFSCHIFLIKTR